MTATLPRLLDAKTLATELGIADSAAWRMMRHIGVTPVGRRYFVTDEQVRDYLEREKQPGHLPKKGR